MFVKIEFDFSAKKLRENQIENPFLFSKAMILFSKECGRW